MDKSSTLHKLNPAFDDKGILRVGVGLGRADLNNNEQHIVIRPKQHHITTLIVRNYHDEVHHQGRHFTSGIICSRGYCIVTKKHLIDGKLNKCVTCCKLQEKCVHQQMADLPPQQLLPSAPDTHVGLDVIGPWKVLTCRTMGSVSSGKCWTVLFALLPMKTMPLRAPPGDFGHPTDIFGCHWQREQHLVNTFWSRWCKEYLLTLQPLMCWQVKKHNLCVSNIILLKVDARRKDWPYGCVIETLPSIDIRVRKVRTHTMKDGKLHIYLRPVTEVVLLIPAGEE